MPEKKKIVNNNNCDNTNSTTKTEPIPIKKNEYVVSRPFSAKQTTMLREFPTDRCICKTGRWCDFCLGDYDDFL